MSARRPTDWAALLAAASAARAQAYAPYSGYQVGAAVRSASGRIFAGCNVENASYGLCLCAERTAVAAMVAAGERSFDAVAVVTEGPELGAPCGMCRQTLSEFTTDAEVGLARPGDTAPERIIALADLLPFPFRGDLIR